MMTLLDNLEAYVRTDNKTVGLRADALICISELRDRVRALESHRCEVGLENPDAMLAHLQALSPEDKAELKNLMTRKRR